MRAVFAAFIVSVAVGCFGTSTSLRSQAIWDQMRGKTTEATVVRSVLLDRPLGDHYLTHDLWAGAARPLPHELSTLLAHNGLRLGVYSGIIPEALSQAVNSEYGTIDAMDRSIVPGYSKIIPLNGPLPTAKVRYLSDLAAAPNVTDYEAVEAALNVTLELIDGDRYRLKIEPQVQHGEKMLHIRANEEQTGVTREDRKPLVAFPTLMMDVTLGKTDYLILGPTADPTGTLGAAFFRTPHGDQLRQRTLVLRVAHRPGT
jgi:hypothetical protein